jgi:hypothetical protein
MSALTVKNGLYTVLAGASSLDALTVLKHVPATISTMLIYIRLRRAERGQGGQITSMRYFFLVRLCVPYQDNEGAELLLDSYINAVPAAIDADPTLGGAISSGLATVSTVNSDPAFLDMAGTLCRYADFEVEAVEKAAYLSGI